MVYIVMGVSGCGKTTIGRRLAQRMTLPFFDADDFHPPENIQKMKSGVPLTDEDRTPWLQALSDLICEWNRNKGAVLACSALKQTYREQLSSNGKEPVTFIFLKGSKSLIFKRLQERDKHYMPTVLLDSQFSDLEEPRDAITLSVDRSPADLVDELCRLISF
ncbi:gluconokinase [Balneolaceae bacterium ANBcel3]|nr:gluconokinase [Balneolaceae bacterium ANBcel3]